MEAAFEEWFTLASEVVDEHAPNGPAAVQLRRASGLVDYPTGKSAMVFYFYAATDARAALHKLFDDELRAQGSRGQGQLWFRVMVHPEAQAHVAQLFETFEARFGAPPIFNNA